MASLGLYVAFVAALLGVWLNNQYVPPGFAPVPLTDLVASTREGKGVFAHNTLLRDYSRRIHVDETTSPETVWFDKNGTLYTVSANDGKVMTKGSDGRLHDWAFTGGAPLSGVVLDDGSQIVAVPVVGLVRIDARTRQSTVLCSTTGGQAIRFADDLAVSHTTGKVYFSDASMFMPIHTGGNHFDTSRASIFEFLSGQHTGRLIEYDHQRQTCRVLKSGLLFSNGVALSQDESFVLVAETFRARIHRIWLKGDKAGTSDIFVDDLPFFVDSISNAPDGGFWVGGVSPQADDVLRTFVSHTILQNLLARLPAWIVSKAEKNVGAVFKLDANGNVVQFLEDPKGEKVYFTTAATEHDGVLYLGSFHNYITVVDLKDLPKDLPKDA